MDQHCILCNNSMFTEFLSTDEDKYVYYMCSECNLVRLRPTPSHKDIATWYSNSYYDWRNQRKSSNRIVKTIRKVWLDIYQGIRFDPVSYKDGRWLDLGCGVGEMLVYVKNKGFEAMGTELSLESIKKVIIDKVKIIESDLAVYNANLGKFDVVSMYSVLEHVRNPRKVINISKRYLKSDGVFAIEVPNIANWQFNYFKEDWQLLTPPLHITQFSKSTLVKMLDKEGLVLEKWKINPLAEVFTTRRNCLAKYENIIIAYLVFLILAVPSLLVPYITNNPQYIYGTFSFKERQHK